MAIPALLLGALVSLLRICLVDDPWHYQFDKFWLYAATHLSFTTWHWSLFGTSPPGNFPFWSLYCEVWYYIVFGLFFYLRGAWRWILSIAALASFGPTQILTLFPLWVIGSLRYFAGRAPAHQPSSRQFGWKLLIALMVIGYALSKATSLDNYFDQFNSLVPFIKQPQLLGDYALSGFALVIFIAAKRCAFPLLERYAGPIRYLASYSFSAYLFHIPIFLSIDMLLTLTDMQRLHWSVKLLLLLIGAGLGIRVLGPFTEHKKTAYRQFFEGLADRVLPARAS